jgi:taurine dioxygenase
MTVIEAVTLCDALGVEVRNIDLHRELTIEEQEDVRHLYRKHYLLVFRGQELSTNEHLRVLSYLGPIQPNEVGQPRVDVQSNVDNRSAVTVTEIPWHTDGSAYQNPLLYQAGASLYGMEVNDDCAPTWFASNTRAARVLPDELRQRLSDKEAVHVFDYAGTQSMDYSADGLLKNLSRRYHERDFGPTAKRALHPVLWRLPESNDESLYVHYAETDRIVGMDEEESEKLLQQLFEILYASDNIHAHQWRPHDLIIWDEWALSHRRRDVSTDKPRTMRRICLASECWPN